MCLLSSIQRSLNQIKVRLRENQFKAIRLQSSFNESGGKIQILILRLHKQ